MIAAANGDRLASERLLPLVYNQLRKVAELRMAGERRGHTLTATALVHEAYVRLTGSGTVEWAGRAHFYAAAAEAMRRILVDHARARAAEKRGGPEARRAAVSLSALPDPTSAAENSGFLILNDAILRLEEVDPQVATVVRLRYFAGLTIEETASAMGVSAPTVKRAWAFARGWLKERIEADRE
ncbi:MAG: sigma-70 family RNA polymerase sigma factor [Planctomycetes bacterium]|nr:sigma-70 family RNA polymerase sigma factor [Planctomycetota bacterium]